MEAYWAEAEEEEPGGRVSEDVRDGWSILCWVYGLGSRTGSKEKVLLRMGITGKKRLS